MIETLRQQLAASQAREQQMREQVESAFRDGFRSPETYNDTVLNNEDDAWCRSEAFATLSLPYDTTALEAMIAEAGEVMRERCERESWLMAPVLRSIPGVTLEDLRK